MSRKRNMLVDLSNLAWATRFGVYGATQTPNDSFSKERIMMETLQTIVDCAKKFKVTGILIACDSPNVWRKDVYPAYKMNREEKDVFYEDVKNVVIELKDFFNSQTTVPAVSVDKCEADDIIYMGKQLADSNAENIIISSDKDFIQLIDNKTRLYSPAQKKERTSDDPGYDLFLKCIRGDRGDNILSAYPRVREKRLIEAWNDPIEMTNLMEEVRKDDKRKVGDEYEFNANLIDLSRIPQEQKQDMERKIKQVIAEQENSNYDMMGTIRFLRDNSMVNFAKNLNKYSNIFKMTFHIDK